ncbi:MAG: methyltransferase domain-containing protein [Dehalococcoidia bacterium]|nr:methyltransferase domain-containing protein [Dehalococcoidia bacterium]
MPGVGNVDWVERWRGLVSKREAQSLALQTAQTSTRNFWDRRASSFNEMTRQRSGQGDRFLELVSSVVDNGTTIMDVGAGVGRHAIPLAKLGREVVAIESSEQMAQYLEANAEAEGVRNLSVVRSTWELVTQIDPVDVVVCSHVIYSTEDVASFVKKIDDHARQYCFFVLRADQVDGHLDELWKLVHGSEREPEPNLMDFYNLLHQIGILANVEIVPFGSGSGSRWTYAAFEDAMDHCRGRLYTLPDTREDRIISDYLKQVLVEQDGKHVWPAPQIRAGIVWWKQEDGGR